VKHHPPILDYAQSFKRSAIKPEDVARVIVPCIAFLMVMVACGLWIGYHVDVLNSGQITLLAFAAYLVAAVILIGTERVFGTWVLRWRK